jgi:hypothetical protein
MPNYPFTHLSTIVRRKSVDSYHTNLVLDSTDGRYKEITYSVPLNMPDLGVGGRINFVEGRLTEVEGGDKNNNS